MSEPPLQCQHLLHRSTFRVYCEDTDFSGYVYHAGYLRFLERGRTEFLRSRGITQSTLHRDEDGLVFVVRRIVVDYLRPARMDDVLTVTTRLIEARGASLRLRQAVLREPMACRPVPDGGETLTEAEVTVASVRAGRPVRLPPEIRAALHP